MTAEISDSEADSPRRRRFPWLGRGARIALVIALVVFVVLAGLWTQRKPIAARYVDAYLAEHGVAATYDIEELGLGGQRLINVVIGDPKRPDLVADWIELGTQVSLTGAEVLQVRAGHVRLHGRLIDGKFSLGAIDKLLPASSGKPFVLPDLDVDVADARMRLETPQGLIGLKLAGHGNLTNGFAGTLAAVSNRVVAGPCEVDHPAAVLHVSVARARPTLTGPVRARGVTCSDISLAYARADVKAVLGAAFDTWQGDTRIVSGELRHPLAKVASVAGTIDFKGDAKATRGTLKLDARALVSAHASGAGVGVEGRYVASNQVALEPGSTVTWDRIAVPPSRLAMLRGLATRVAGTPIGPLAAQLAQAVEGAGRSLSGSARIGYDGAGAVHVSQIALTSASGLKAALDNADLRYDPQTGALQLAGALKMGGGGFPDAMVTLAQAAPGAPITGTASLRRPYTAGGASLAFTPLTFSATPRGNSRFATRLTLSGPLGDGRIDGLDLPVSGIWNGRGRLAINPDCTAIGWRKLAVSGMELHAATLKLCPITGALLSLDGSRLGGGATIAGPRLTGSLGSTPITLAASGSQLRLGDMGFALSDLAVRIGSPERLTQLDFAALTGKIAGSTITGAFTDGGGQIGNVPLILSGAAGDWGLKGGVLDVTGGMTVADAASGRRFEPLAVRDVTLSLKDGVIRAGGKLIEPSHDVAISDVAIVHDLGKGSGSADLMVPGIVFADKGLQPDDLTKLVFGVITNVVGKVSGEGHIHWSSDAVTSDGVFRTAGIDLAAALGPVNGIATEIRFTDLLSLQSAPGQIATIKTINTGIVVQDGVIRYQTLPDARVQVEDGRWPFAGGSLVLEPTLLDFAEKQQRRMTLTVTGMEAPKFLAQFEFENLNATGVFDGSMPMVFDESGGRIVGGKLNVRAGGGTIAYLGEVSKENLGTWGNLAFQALKSLRYRSLDLVMNGPLSGEMVTEVRFAGVNQAEGSKRNFLFDRLQRLPLVFNVKIKAPFRGLFDSARSFYDPSRLVERNLPDLVRERDRQAQKPPVTPQPSPPPSPAPPNPAIIPSVQHQESEPQP